MTKKLAGHFDHTTSVGQEQQVTLSYRKQIERSETPAM